MKNRFLIILFTLMSLTLLFGQAREYEGPIDPAGDQAALREGYMTGNRFRLYFNNQGRLGHWPFIDGSRFPATSERGLDLFDSNILVVGAKVYVENGSTPVTETADIQAKGAAGQLDTLYFCLSGRTDHAIDTSPDGIVEWGMQPVFGYFNVNSESPAVSTDPDSWPPEGWPSTGFERKWTNSWNGRFGPYPYAHFETYYVVNDAQDQENLQADLPATYSPRALSNVKIGDLRPEVTTQKGLPWGGVGLRVATRGYQWDNPQTRDIIFWEYDITNISDYNLPEVVFGYIMDLGIGHFFGTGDGEDDVGSFNADLDMSYCWDLNGTGYSNYLVGTFGFAFLESPGVPNDGLDNDDDGLIDEKRDNHAVNFIGATEGITDIDKFLTAYGMKLEDLKDHWDADEDQDWDDGVDLNGNGIYDSGEIAGDDIGIDGLGPGELNYPGPDPDGSECNHRPDFVEGVGCEPDFAATDITESDMLGLTSFHLFSHHQGGERWVTHDKTCFGHLTDGILDDEYQDPANLNQSFSSGTFILPKGRTERISMAVIAAFENLATLNDTKQAPILFDRKKVVQTIYESDYRFARPPIMPTLTATPGDGKVTLTWDNKADKDTRESLLGGINDFEGYKLYKATDIAFADAERLRDGFGNPAGNLPIFQCDLKNDFSGFTDYAFVEGEGYYLGGNSGLQHYYIDTDVDNGRTYYYYLTAYDRGIKEMNIAPSENVKTIVMDETEAVTFNTPNVAIVIPRPPVNDFTAPGINIITNIEDIGGTGTIAVDVADPMALKPGNKYKLMFTVDTLNLRPRVPEELDYYTSGFQVYNITDGANELIYEENPNHFVGINILSENISATKIAKYLNTFREVKSDIFDGLQLKLNDLIKAAEWDSVIGTGWVQGYAPVNFDYNRSRMASFPWQYDLVFTSEDNMFTSTFSGGRMSGVDNKNIKANEFLLHVPLPFYVENKNFIDPKTGVFKKLDIVPVDRNANGTFDLFEDEIMVGYTYDEGTKWHRSIFSFNFHGLTEEDFPNPGDVFRVDFIRPLSPADSIIFQIVSPEALGVQVEEDMAKIKVVPNPYILTNSMESSVRNNALNQRRRLMFTNVPAECEIKIFTMSGYLVDVIEVHNTYDNGIVHWDLLTQEGLEIAAGVYIYHLKSFKTGKEKLDKFAVIK